jgi:hypothetical protein
MLLRCLDRGGIVGLFSAESCYAFILVMRSSLNESISVPG